MHRARGRRLVGSCGARLLSFGVVLALGVITSMPVAQALSDPGCGGATLAESDLTSYVICDPAPPDPLAPGHACPTATYAVGAVATPTDVAHGATTSITVGGFAPGSTVVATLCNDELAVVLGTFVADAAGNVDITVTVPDSVPAGAYTLAVTGRHVSGVTLTAYARVNVICYVGGDAGCSFIGTLPVTGTDSGRLLGLAGVLFALGGAAAVGSRRATRRAIGAPPSCNPYE